MALTPDCGTGRSVAAMTVLSIGELADAAGVGVETVRFYERRGLLPEPPRSAAGYRQYSEADVWRLDFVRRAKALGFTLNEIVGLMGDAQPGRARTADEVLAAGQAKLAELEAQARELAAMKERLQRLVELCEDGDGLGCTALAIEPSV